MNLKEYKSKKMNDPEFAKAYEEIQPEMNVRENRYRPDRDQQARERNKKSFN